MARNSRPEKPEESTTIGQPPISTHPDSGCAGGADNSSPGDALALADLSQNYRRLEAFAKLSSGWFWELDERLNYRYLSQSFSEITGIPVVFALGESDDGIGTSEHDPEAWHAHRQRLHQHQSFRNFEYSLLHPDGRSLRLSANGVATFDGNGRFSGFRGTTIDITEVAAERRTSRRIRALYKLAGHFAKLGYWEWDEIEDECIYCSEELARFRGVSVEEYLRRSQSGTNGWPVIFPDDRARYEHVLEEFAARPTTTEVQYRTLNDDGTISFVLEVIAPIFDNDDTLTRSIGYVQDISERELAAEELRMARDELEQRVQHRTFELQQANEELRASEQRLREAAKIARLGHFRWDTMADRAIYCDREFANILGVEHTECINQSIEEYVERIHPEDADGIRQSYKESFIEAGPYDMEYRVVRPDGDVRYVHEYSRPIFGENGLVVQTFGILQDVTERKLISQGLAATEERLHELTTNAREIFWILSADARQVIYISPAFEEVFGQSCQSLLRNPLKWRDSVHPDDRKHLLNEARQKIDGHDTTPDFTEFRIVHPDGDIRWILARAYPIYHRDGSIARFAGFAEDVTERKATEEALHQAQKMEAVGQLTGGVAHDFNNLLAVILGNAKLLRGSLSHDGQNLLSDIILAANRGAVLTHRLLAFSRQQPLRPVETDINSLIDDVFQMLRRTLGATITIKLDLTPEPAIVLVDPNLLESAVLNLALNARDSMPNGGTLSISTVEKSTPATGESASHGDPPADQLLITIEDTGTGMSPAILSRAMEPFFTTKEIGQGSGLGLSTAYGFAKQSRGDLLIESQEGIGTKAVLSLPRMAARLSPLNTPNSDGLPGLQQEQ